MSDADLSRFDRDPDAVAWARAKVVRLRDRYRGFEQSAAAAGKPEQASTWRRLANMIDMQMVGGKGCSIAAFDERLPAMTVLMDGAGEEDGDGERGPASTVTLREAPSYVPPEPVCMAPEAEHLARYCTGQGCRSSFHQPVRNSSTEGERQ